MTGHVAFIPPEAAVQEAAVMMGELDIGGLPVGAEDDLIGIVTDRDILYRLVARGRDPARTRVREVMTSPVIACAPDDTVEAVMDLMAAQHIRRAPVCEAAGRVLGWITLADLSRRLLLEDPALQDRLRQLTEAPG
ncbi:CBS domain-containing protein [Siccirubricoccus sp. G192]|nr:CBS domain-containing protein [Siccirubricoccus sp. G192]